MTKRLLYIGQPGASAAAVYSATGTTVLDAVTVCNPTAGDADLGVYIVPSGDTAAADTQVYKDLVVTAGQSVSLGLLVNHCLPSGASLQMIASDAATLTVTVSGRVG